MTFSGCDIAAVSSRTNEPVAPMFWFNRRRGFVAAVVVAAAWLVGASAAVASRWKVVATARGGEYSFNAVSCFSARACTAVGANLALRSNGSAWSTQKMAEPVGSTPQSLWSFAGVSCPSVTSCFAVGQLTDGLRNFALAERWNGSRWSEQRVPTPGGRSKSSDLAAVSCTSATACTAVGGYGTNALTGFGGHSLIERWTGSSWSIQKAPAAGSSLSGVSCTARTLCTAVGYDYTPVLGHLEYDGPIALRWNGRGWSLSQSPYQTAQVNAVSCTSATACTWVGDFVVGGWDGTNWTESGNPNAGGTDLYAVSCTAATACTAVGIVRGGVLAWNGSRWSSQQTPRRGVLLTGVSCTSDTVCTVVGQAASGSVVERRS